MSCDYQLHRTSSACRASSPFVPCPRRSRRLAVDWRRPRNGAGTCPPSRNAQPLSTCPFPATGGAPATTRPRRVGVRSGLARACRDERVFVMPSRVSSKTGPCGVLSHSQAHYRTYMERAATPRIPSTSGRICRVLPESRCAQTAIAGSTRPIGGDPTASPASARGSAAPLL
jgi:hypothetical protein